MNARPMPSASALVYGRSRVTPMPWSALVKVLEVLHLEADVIDGRPAARPLGAC
jgi:hypothetical protein